jgi:hypothetical protein
MTSEVLRKLLVAGAAVAALSVGACKKAEAPAASDAAAAASDAAAAASDAAAAASSAASDAAAASSAQ